MRAPTRDLLIQASRGALEIPIEFDVDAQSAGRTLAEVVRSHMPAPCSWNQARELCKRGKVRSNGRVRTDAVSRVVLGEHISIDPRAPRLREHVLHDSALVFVDAHLVVVNKPADLLSVPFDARDRNTLVDRLRLLLRRRHGVQGAELGVVQRLDKDTTGLMVFARTLAAKRQLQQLFRTHAIERRYRAIAHGVVEACRMETLLVANRGDGLRGSYGKFRRARGPAPDDAQRALTEVRPLEALRGATLIECQLSTGRQHQIRIHLSEAGHPLVGEQVYIREHSGPRIAAPRIMLHAAVLGFAHPLTGEPLRFELPPPEDFQAVYDELRGSGPGV
jgi:23S rRNA pseudouridine1911/1915/1917 synthase